MVNWQKPVGKRYAKPRAERRGAAEAAKLLAVRGIIIIRRGCTRIKGWRLKILLPGGFVDRVEPYAILSFEAREWVYLPGLGNSFR
jgi:hypothetical protein